MCFPAREVVSPCCLACFTVVHPARGIFPFCKSIKNSWGLGPQGKDTLYPLQGSHHEYAVCQMQAAMVALVFMQDLSPKKKDVSYISFQTLSNCQSQNRCILR